MITELVLSASLVAAVLISPANQREIKLDDAFIDKDIFEYNGYVIRRTFPVGDDSFSRIAVLRGKKELARVDGCCYKDSARYALVSLLGHGSKQLVIEEYSGGGHCCTAYHIYDLGPRFRQVFDGDDYSADDIGYSMNLVDLNRDGVYEFAQSVMNFDYFYASHAKSVFPEVVFAYSRQAGEFRPANRAFAKYLLRDIKDKKATVSKLNMDAATLARVRNGRRSSTTLEDSWFVENYYNAVADVSLTYVFAGKRKEGWRYFENNYRLGDKADLRAGLLDILEGSVIYRSIYPRK